MQRTCLAALFLFASFATNAVSSTIAGVSADGWHTWRVNAVDGVPDWCCFVWNAGVPQKKSCDLNARHANFGSSGDRVGGVEEMQMYALMEAGKAIKIRAFSPQCRVTAQTDIADLGVIAVDDSVAWLEQQIFPRTSVSSHALAAISVHDGRKSRNVLVDVARHNTSFENRKDAVFWMGQVRGSETANEIEALMFDDDDPELREHAAFSLSQSNAPGRAKSLIQLGHKDTDANVRAKAWFWLAQTKASESESAIQNAISDEENRTVRHEAIFALSQLPQARALAALMTVVESRELIVDDRKQALFWLAESGSDEAIEYLDRLLSTK